MFESHDCWHKEKESERERRRDKEKYCELKWIGCIYIRIENIEWWSFFWTFAFFQLGLNSHRFLSAQNAINILKWKYKSLFSVHTFFQWEKNRMQKTSHCLWEYAIRWYCLKLSACACMQYDSLSPYPSGNSFFCAYLYRYATEMKWKIIWSVTARVIFCLTLSEITNHIASIHGDQYDFMI